MKHGLGGIAFEAETQDRLRALGWQVEATPITGDFGADLLARSNHELIVVQCKDYGVPAGVSAVQEAHFARTHYAATAALVVARNGFTKAAIRAAATTGIKLLTPSDIRSGSSLDRTEARRNFERQQADAARAERDRKQEADRVRAKAARASDKKLRAEYESEEWRDHDDNTRRAAKVLRWNSAINRYVPLGAIAVTLGTLFLQWGNSALGETCAVELFAGLGIWIVLRDKPVELAEPEFDRKRAIIKCATCKQSLRVDLGKTGKVRCPRCQNVNHART